MFQSNQPITKGLVKMYEEEIELIKVLLPLFAAIIAAIMAYLENRKKKSAEMMANDFSELYQKESRQNAALVSPGYASPGIVSDIPGAAWKMSEDTKQFLTAGAFKPYTVEILKQVDQAERENRVKYAIYVPGLNVQYNIEYGLLKSQVGNT